MRIAVILLYFFTLVSSVSFELEHTIKSKETLIAFAPDQFGNILAIQGDNLVKLNPKGDKIAAYSNPSFGTPTSLTAQDALNPLLFYQETYTLISLDNRLNESLITNFLEAGFYDVTLVCQGDEERVWLYDQAQDKLFNYNILQNKIEVTTLNITQLTGIENKPTQLLSTFNYTYVNIPEKGILRFTATGAFDKVIPLKNITYFDVSGQELYFTQDSTANIQSFNMQTSLFSELSLSVPENGFESFKFSAKKLYLKQAKTILAYKQTTAR